MSEPAVASGRDPAVQRYARWMALAILVAAAGLRLATLDLHSLWLDEAASLQFARHDTRGCLLAEVNNPPLNRLLLHGWIRLGGDGSDAWLRLLPALLGILACVAFWGLARRVLPTAAALAALWLFAFNPYHLLLSQEIRAYSLLVLVTVLAWLLHLQTLSRDAPRWKAFALAGVLVAGLHTHYQFAWVALALTGHRVLRAWGTRAGAEARPGWPRLRQGARLLWPVALAGLAFGPWLVVFLTHVGHQVRGYTTGALGRAASLPFMLLLGESAAVRKYPATYTETAAAHWYLVVVFGLAAIPVVIQGVRVLWAGAEPPEETRQAAAGPAVRAGRFLLVAAALPLVGLLVLFSWLPLFTARYLSFLMPVLCLIVAAGGLWFRPQWLGRAVLGILVALQLFSLGRYHFDPAFGRENWRAAAAWVDARERPGDRILFDHHYVQLPFDRYHRGHAEKKGLPDGLSARVALLSRVAQAGSGKVFVVLSHTWDTGHQSVDFLAGHLCHRERRVFPQSNGIEVHLFTRCRRARNAGALPAP